MIIIDCGCCVGLFVQDAFDKYGDDIEKIYGIEPLTANYEHLKEKYKDNPKVEIFNYAVSDVIGESKFYMKGRGQFAGNAGCSLKADKTNVNSNAYQMVNVITLKKFMEDQNIERVDILKVDCEGSEYAIIESIIDDLDKFDKIMYENHTHKIASIKNDRKRVEQMIKDRNVIDKFWLQSNHLDYAPLRDMI
jgi:FkbM family methyltransferase